MVRTRYGVRPDNPNTRPWRQAVAAEAMVAMSKANIPITLQPVELQLEFCFPRPKHHWRTGRYANLLKDSAPYYHTSKPDLDKLARAVADALTGVVYRDDSQIAKLTVRKVWWEQPAASVRVTELAAE